MVSQTERNRTRVRRRGQMPSDFTVRVATPEDEPRVSELLRSCYPALLPKAYDEAILVMALPMMTRANPALLSSGTYYVAAAQECGLLVGCGGWTRERPGTGEIEPGLAHIRHFATHPEWLGRGIGRAIYTQSEMDARANGTRRFECYASLNAEGFYEALGFRTLQYIDVAMGPQLKFPSVLMQRPVF